MKRQSEMTPEERAQQELEWAREFFDKRLRLVTVTKQAMNTPSPTRRRELYQKWRELYGDDYARSYAKFAEAAIAGTVSIAKLEKSVQGERP